MTRKVIKLAAKYYAAGVVYNALGCGGSSELLTSDEWEIFQEEVTNIAYKLVSSFEDGIESLNVGSLDGLILLAQKKQK